MPPGYTPTTVTLDPLYAALRLCVYPFSPHLVAQYTDSLALPRVAAVLITLAILRFCSSHALSVWTHHRIMPLRPLRHLSTSAAS